MNDQWYNSQVLKWLCNDVFKWYSYILENTERTQKTYKDNNESSIKVSVVY